MSILEKILAEIRSDDNTEKIRELCDKIQDEEAASITHINQLPEGPNIFLALEVPGRNIKEVGFLTLEREAIDNYILVFSTIPNIHIDNPKISCKRRQVWPLEESKPAKVLTAYAQKYKFLRGE